MQSYPIAELILLLHQSDKGIAELKYFYLVKFGHPIQQQSFRHLSEHPDDSIEERLKQTLSYSLDFIEEQCQLLSAIKAPNCEDDLTLIYHSPIYKSKHDIFRNLLEEIPCKNASKPLDTTYAADLIIAAMAPGFFKFLCDDRGYSKDEIRDNLYNLCIRPLLVTCNEKKN